jgi:farnesyl diphosphate synthase
VSQASRREPTPGRADFSAQVAACKARIELVLERALTLPDPGTARLREAMRYSVLGGGKRLRPTLVYLTGESLGAAPEALDAPAAAVELIHVYSLVHDDLPAMDDDDLRRGRPTCHKAYDEATAILVGDALQPLAFQLLARDPTLPAAPAIRLRLIELLAQASGTLGMAGGQAIDLAVQGQLLGIEQVEALHARKTGALIRASVLMAFAFPAGACFRKKRTIRNRFASNRDTIFGGGGASVILPSVFSTVRPRGAQGSH